MEIRLLGSLEVVDGGRRIELPSGQPRALLALLALSPGTPFATDRIVEALWDDAPPPSAAGVVQTYVSRLRKLLGDDAIRRSSGGYALELDGGTRDIDEVLRLRTRARTEPPADAAATLLEARRLFRGRPLEEVADHEFAQVELRRLEGLRTSIVAECLDAQLAVGEHAEVLPELEALVASDPLDEGVRARLMLALYRCGRQAEALDVYRDGRSALGELGLEPGETLRHMQRAVLEHDPSLAPPVPVEDEGREAGEQRTARGRGRRWGMIAAIAGASLVVAATVAAVIALRDGAAPAGVAVAADSVAVLDPSTGRVVADIPVGTRPRSVTAGAGVVWVTNSEDRTVTRIDPVRRVVTGSVGLGFEPTDAQAVPGGVWVAGGFDHALWRIDDDGVPRRKLTFTERFGPLPPGYERGPAGLALSRQGLWLAHGNEVSLHDPITGEERGTFEAGGNWVVPIAVGERGYVFDNAHDRSSPASPQFVQAFDPARRRPTSRIDTAMDVSDIFIADGIAWIALFRGDAVWQVDDRRAVLLKTFPVGDTPVGLAFADDALWVVSEDEAVVRRVDPSSGTIERVVDVGHTLAGVAVADGLLFVAVRAP
jgi:YVTN family beta-propeller protein